jgi:transposase, IS30 family
LPKRSRASDAHRNTNGLLPGRYFPTAPTYPDWGAGYLDYVAAELNNQPARRLGWKTHAEALDELLPSPETHLLLQ